MGTQLIFRLPIELKSRFDFHCKQNHTNASREIRQFMRKYINDMEEKTGRKQPAE